MQPTANPSAPAPSTLCPRGCHVTHTYAHTHTHIHTYTHTHTHTHIHTHTHTRTHRYVNERAAFVEAYPPKGNKLGGTMVIIP